MLPSEMLQAFRGLRWAQRRRAVCCGPVEKRTVPGCSTDLVPSDLIYPASLSWQGEEEAQQSSVCFVLLEAGCPHCVTQ